MKKIATAAIAVFSCLIFLSPTATPPRVHASEYRSDCLYVYTCEPTLTDDDFRQAGGSIPDRLPIAPSEFYGALQQGIFEPNDRLYFILEMDGLYTDDTTLANQFIQWRDKGVCIMLITHYDERLIGDNMEPDDIRIDYMNYANVFLCLDVFYDFATDVLANTIIDTQRFNDESWIDKTTNKTAFNSLPTTCLQKKQSIIFTYTIIIGESNIPPNTLRTRNYGAIRCAKSKAAGI